MKPRIPSWRTDLTREEMETIMADVLDRYREPPYPLEWADDGIPFIQLIRPRYHPVPVVTEASQDPSDPLGPVSARQAAILRTNGYQFVCCNLGPVVTFLLTAPDGAAFRATTTNGPAVRVAVADVIDKAWAHFLTEGPRLTSQAGRA